MTEQLQAALCEIDDFSLIVLIVNGLWIILSIGNTSDLLHDIFGLANETDECPVLGFEELEKRPSRDVLECRITRFQEAAQVAVNTTIRFVPILHEYGVIADYKTRVRDASICSYLSCGVHTFGREVTQCCRAVSLHFDTGGVCQGNEDVEDSEVQKI